MTELRAIDGDGAGLASGASLAQRDIAHCRARESRITAEIERLEEDRREKAARIDALDAAHADEVRQLQVEHAGRRRPFMDALAALDAGLDRLAAERAENLTRLEEAERREFEDALAGRRRRMLGEDR